MLDDLDLEGFWSDSDYARRSYVESPPTPGRIREVEAELGFKLPAAYVALMRVQNGGVPVRRCFPTTTSTSWARDHVAITGIMGIGSTKTLSLLGGHGSPFMQEEWGYPKWGVCVCDCPSAGHDMIMLDYRECGAEGEPSVVHVDQEGAYRVTYLAPTFESFVSGLVEDFEVGEHGEELAADLAIIATGAWTTELRALFEAASGALLTEARLRGALRKLALEKREFALHDDGNSRLVYDALFDLYSTVHPTEQIESFLEAFEALVVVGEGDVMVYGHAARFLRTWSRRRTREGKIVLEGGRLVLSATQRAAVERRLACHDEGVT